MHSNWIRVWLSQNLNQHVASGFDLIVPRPHEAKNNNSWRPNYLVKNRFLARSIYTITRKVAFMSGEILFLI
jgi:hypothetical protein